MRFSQKSRFLEKIPTFPKGSFSFVAPEHYHIHDNFRANFAQKIGLYLCANKASLQIDPMNWEAWHMTSLFGLTRTQKFFPLSAISHSKSLSNEFYLRTPAEVLIQERTSYSNPQTTFSTIMISHFPQRTKHIPWRHMCATHNTSNCSPK